MPDLPNIQLPDETIRDGFQISPQINLVDIPTQNFFHLHRDLIQKVIEKCLYFAGIIEGMQVLDIALSGKWDWEERMKVVARHVDKESRDFEMVNLLQSLKDKLTAANLKSLNDFSEILDTCIQHLNNISSNKESSDFAQMQRHFYQLAQNLSGLKEKAIAASRSA
jgi:hypothetical protein